jgi:hypothetical protein
MPIIEEIAQAMQEVLTDEAAQAGRTSSFVQRAAKFDGSAFVQTFVFTYLSDPHATVTDLAQTAASLGITITGSGIVQRCTAAATTCVQTVLGKAVQRVLVVKRPISAYTSSSCRSWSALSGGHRGLARKARGHRAQRNGVPFAQHLGVNAPFGRDRRQGLVLAQDLLDDLRFEGWTVNLFAGHGRYENPRTHCAIFRVYYNSQDGYLYSSSRKKQTEHHAGRS